MSWTIERYPHDAALRLDIEGLGGRVSLYFEKAPGIGVVHVRPSLNGAQMLGCAIDKDQAEALRDYLASFLQETRR